MQEFTYQEFIEVIKDMDICHVMRGRYGMELVEHLDSEFTADEIGDDGDMMTAAHFRLFISDLQSSLFRNGIFVDRETTNIDNN